MEKEPSWIDLEAVINELSNDEGYISKKDLLDKIASYCPILERDELSMHLDVVKRTPKPIFRINNASELIGNINKYQQGQWKPAYRKLIGNCLTRLNLSKSATARILSWPSYYTRDEDEKELEGKDLIMTGNELLKILKITRPTLINWQSKGIALPIERYARIKTEHGIFDYPYRYGWIKYYDLSVIKLQIKAKS